MTRRAVAPEKVHDGLDTIVDQHGRWALSQIIRQNQLNRFREYAGDDRTEAATLPAVTQSDISERLDLTSSHISKVTNSLVDAGFVTNTGSVRPTGTGRPRRPLRVNADVAILAVVVEDDAAITSLQDALEPRGQVSRIFAAAVGLDGELKYPIEETPVPRSDEDQLLDDVIAISRKIVRKHSDVQWVGMSVVVGGQVRDGRVEFSAGMGDRRGRAAGNRNWVDVLTANVGLPVTIENDANSLAQFDAWVGRRAERSYLYVAIKKDGIGAGVIMDGRLLGGTAGEIGHFPVDTRAMFEQSASNKGVPCRCGHFGCLETLATPNALSRDIDDRQTDSLELALSDYQRGRPTESSAKAYGSFKRAGRALGIALAGTVNLFSADLVVISGPAELLMEHRHSSASILLDGVREALGKHSLSVLRPRIECISVASDATELAAAALCAYAKHLDWSRPLFAHLVAS